MAKIISKIDTIIKLPPNFKNLCGKEGFTAKLKAYKSVEVPDVIAEYFVTNRGHVFAYLDEIEGKNDETETETETENNNNPEEFNAIDFLERNINNEFLELELSELTLENLKKIAEILNLTGYNKQPKDRLIERIVTDIEIKKNQEKDK